MLYVKNVQATCDFYERYFGFVSEHFADDRVVELRSANGGATLMAHPAAKSVKTGYGQTYL